VRWSARAGPAVAKSRAEIERTLERYGATAFMYGSQADRAIVGFEMNDRNVRFVIPLPDRNSQQFTHHERGRRTESASRELYEKAVRQKWRALALVVKAKLEAVESGISVFEEEFLANIVLPGGKTVYETTRGGIETAYQTGKVTALLQIEGGK
jgi:hypothetical protein